MPALQRNKAHDGDRCLILCSLQSQECISWETFSAGTMDGTHNPHISRDDELALSIECAGDLSVDMDDKLIMLSVQERSAQVWRCSKG